MAIMEQDFPLQIKISFSKLFEKYRELCKSESYLSRERAEGVLNIASKFPELEEGVTSLERIKELAPEIEMILEDAFAPVLQSNEIKIATIPFNNAVLKATERYQNIVKAAGKDFIPRIKNLDEDHYYIMGCSMILKQYYGFKIDFRRPFFYDIPDASKILRHYRILYNADFIEIQKTANAKEITADDVSELLDNFDNVAVWKEKFPPSSWVFKGVIIANLFDATIDVALSEFKTSLLKYDKTQTNFVTKFEEIFQAIFNLPEIKVGFTAYNEEEGILERVPDRSFSSYILSSKDSETCEEVLCDRSYENLLKQSIYFAISDIERQHKLDRKEKLYKNLEDKGIKSAILAPIVHNKKFLGVLEIVSPNSQELNSINAYKLEDIMPYLMDAVVRSRQTADNEIELLIQRECTSIHPSVYWRFRQEARKVLYGKAKGRKISFNDVVFENVYPLYGQIDIKGSSEARNQAIQKDIVIQLTSVKKIINTIASVEKLPIYEQLIFRINSYITEIEKQLEVDSEKKVLDFIKNEIRPLFRHSTQKGSKVGSLIKEYNDMINDDLDLVYRHRKAYDDSVMQINKELANLLDEKQVEAQAMYPHFFERFKTDGVEHNIYIGESITKRKSFNKIYLHNLRLWQLQVMCELENEYYQLKKKLITNLDVTSMILVFNTSLSVRFRMDEKRFDVDGTYNARYEVIKKRVDKSFIKNSQQRVVQKGKLVIIYSQRSDEKEYMRYLQFLQSKNYLEDQIEIVELEDLQGITGLKALRVNILYHKNNDDKEFYTYEDLMKEINN
ncbi:GAF domain-containing protein [Aquimarina sp. ERC-38]|uniref:GAF domain-containing protein n=1 Tax=Aquimarina sp. ERC-38 TaxID=2949996 RepID=UPI002245DAA2|nr:GAF domain-containing protein [Aquimarina sp. ERC-38]UZO79865.1 GAF domain-containing protein [Aquimarina sp. ERC-38]